MKVMTILGTRPEIIRLSRIIPRLDSSCDHVLVHTGQNFDPRLSEIFFQELGLRSCNEYLDVRGDSPAQIMAGVLTNAEAVLAKHRPDRLLILGDTYSGLSAMIARRMQIPVFHMEAGNRCFDFRVPEEANRRIIDHVSTILLPYTNRSRDHLLAEGFNTRSVYVTGNPIKEVLDHHALQVSNSGILDKLRLAPGQYILATVHRAENVDSPERLAGIFAGLQRASHHFSLPVICSAHPRTRERLAGLGRAENGSLIFSEPFGLFDFVQLEKNAFCVVSDSGTVQEEACIFGVPTVTVRDVTERPETIECGSNVLAGADPDRIVSLIHDVTRHLVKWVVPPEYLVANVSETVVRIVTGYLA
ncbi:MAG: UDP-N-acetylglucosamine 2-epimerase (non-hydrolyzing) [Acidobacteriaceae bacterium]